MTSESKTVPEIVEVIGNKEKITPKELSEMDGVNKTEEESKEFLVQLKEGKGVLSHGSFQEEIKDVEITIE